MNDIIQSIVESYHAGSCTRLSAYMDLLYLTPSQGVQAVVDSLPEEWKHGFTKWLIDKFDNDIPVEEYQTMGLSDNELTMDPNPIAVVKDWLHRKPSQRSGHQCHTSDK